MEELSATSSYSLQNLFSDIASSIRSKKGTDGAICAYDFPYEIESITTGFPNGTEWRSTNVITNPRLSIIRMPNSI